MNIKSIEFEKEVIMNRRSIILTVLFLLSSFIVTCSVGGEKGASDSGIDQDADVVTVSDSEGTDIYDTGGTGDIFTVCDFGIPDSGCRDECTENVCKDNQKLNVCRDWDGDGCKEYKEIDCPEGCENSICKGCIPDCSGKMCGDDGCGGFCGDCGKNAFCILNKCECSIYNLNCNSKWEDGCEKERDMKYIWNKGFGANSNEVAYSIYVDMENNVYIAGKFDSSSLDFGGEKLTNAGDYDIFLAKFDSNGNHIWSKSFGGSGDDEAHSIAVDTSGNIYITGWFKSSTIDFGGEKLTNAGDYDIFLAKFDSNGNHIWSKGFGGKYADYSYSLSLDNSNNLFLTGYFNSSDIDFGGGAMPNKGNADIFLAKFDSKGDLKWSESFGGNSADWVSSVATDKQGNVYITGTFDSDEIDFGGGLLKNAGDYDVYLAKFDGNGKHIWSKRFGGSDIDNALSIAIDNSNNVLITGYYGKTGIDFGGEFLQSAGEDGCRYGSCVAMFIAKFDTDGNHIWSKRWGELGDTIPTSIKIDSIDNLIVTGYFSDNKIDFGAGSLRNPGKDSIFVAKYDGDGYHKWSRILGGIENDYSYAVALDNLDNIYVTGSFSDEGDFGVCPIKGNGQDDIFFIKYAP